MNALAQPAATRDMADEAECQRTQSIMAAANALLDEEGLEGLTIRAMLKRTGLARRAFYDRFPGKDDLVLAVFAETLKEAADHFDHEAARLSDPLDQVKLIVMGLVLGTRPQNDAISSRRVWAIVREHMRLAQTRPSELDSALRPLLGVITERISAGIRSGQLREADPALQATLIYNLVASTVHVELLAEEHGELTGYRRQRLADAIWEFCRRAIVA